MKALLTIMVSFVWITATLFGLVLVNHPGGDIMNLSVSLLGETQYTNFLVPGLLLILLVGGVNLIALFYNLFSIENRYEWSIAAGITIGGFILVHMILTRSFSWLQILYLGTGIAIITVAAYLKNEWQSNQRETEIF